jgi:hypothetical protein
MSTLTSDLCFPCKWFDDTVFNIVVCHLK